MKNKNQGDSFLMKHGVLLVIFIADVIMFFNVSALSTCLNSFKHQSFYLKESLVKLNLGIKLDLDTKLPLSIQQLANCLGSCYI